MAARRDARETRARILEAAERVFSETGFDGSRVDEIARVAGVNKALIYHYFPSKNALLDTLLGGLVDDARHMFAASADRATDLTDPDGYRPLFEVYLSFLMARRQILRVAVAESLKTSGRPSIVLELGRLLLARELDEVRATFGDRGLCFPADQRDLLVMEFFTGLMPYVAYALFHDQWVEQYGIAEEDLREAFYDAFRRTHVAAHVAALATISDQPAAGRR